VHPAPYGMLPDLDLKRRFKDRRLLKTDHYQSGVYPVRENSLNEPTESQERKIMKKADLCIRGGILRGLGLVFFIFPALLLFIPALGQAQAKSCVITVGPNANVALDKAPDCSAVQPAQACICVLDNTQLTCQGKKITGGGEGFGIYLEGTVGAEVKKCDVTNFAFGFELRNASLNILEDNTANKNNAHGFTITENSSHNHLNNNPADNNNISGFEVNLSSNNFLRKNKTNKNGLAGFQFLDASNDNLLEENIANNNEVFGIYLDESSDNFLEDNTANANGDGFQLANFSNNNLIEKNKANGNQDFGFEILSFDNYIIKNEASLNGGGQCKKSKNNNDNVLIANSFLACVVEKKVK
jgi:parallel beta-helix repeat protein